ncbi:hypothetical protein INT43_003670 [Umbelopsis isabellina]|uniref:HCP-like protein n=1 Tax=Mortierella isabellina TaxID=91625 RepID=A0A8H7PUT3_MORIS|nr:hypothetical protein INT43_003670 [Umbelopsis isabellina]
MNRLKQAFSPKSDQEKSKKRFSLFHKDNSDKRFSVPNASKSPSLTISTSELDRHSGQPRSAVVSGTNMEPTAAKSQKRHSMFQSAKDISPIQQHATATLLAETKTTLISPVMAADTSDVKRSSSLRRGRSLIVPPRRKSTRVSTSLSSGNEKGVSTIMEESDPSEPPRPPAPQADDGSSTPQADEYLQLGVQFHESGKLEKATNYWRMAADMDHPLGLFFYGIALRHGWGCKPNPAMAVRYLQRAAECAVYDLQTGIAQSSLVAKQELVLAIYELGICFRHGWGVPKNIATAAYYFEIAGNLGDPDAQNDLGFCYAHGQGVKKDNFKAAKYYRMADRQGNGIVGNSWIWKPKYDIVDEPNWDKSQSPSNTMAAVKSIASGKHEPLAKHG